MTDKDPQPLPPPRKLELSPAQVAGSALAAISAAFFASWAGTAGTLIGAGLGSVLATVGAATYTWWLRRTSDAVRRTAAQVRETGMGSTVVVPGLRTRRPPVDEPTADEAASAADEDRWAFLRGRPWGKVLLVSLAVMATAIGGITVVEAVTGKPISDLTRGDSGQGTSVGHLVGNSGPTTPKRKSTPTPTPTPAPSTSPTPTQGTSPTPTPSPQQSTSPSLPPTPSTSASPSAPTGASPQGAPPSGSGSSPGASPTPAP